MTYIPAFKQLSRWLGNHCATDPARVRCTYDDVLDMLSGVLSGVPVDAAWYVAKHPAVAKGGWTATNKGVHAHFQKHGYFEGRQPFEPGWRGLTPPPPFQQIALTLQILPSRGRLFVEVGRDELLGWIGQILRSVPVDQAWYLKTYTSAARAVRSKQFEDATDHFCQCGYFEGYLPHDIAVDSDWYLNRYPHARNGLERGVAQSAKDHFLRIGYGEGCRPVQP